VGPGKSVLVILQAGTGKEEAAYKRHFNSVVADA
jgi:hypothetical protein